MNNWLHKWLEGLGSAYPSAFSPYWRALPMRRLTKLMVGTFFSASVAGFAADLLQLNHPRLGRGFLWPIFGGAMAAGISATRIKKFRPCRSSVPAYGSVRVAGLQSRVGQYHIPTPERAAPARGIRRPRHLDNRQLGLSTVTVFRRYRGPS